MHAKPHQFISSLFAPGGTCVGYAKRLKRQIKLFNAQHELIGVINKWGALLHAKKQEDGKTWYSFMTIQEIGEDNYNYMELASSFAIRTLYNSNEPEYHFA